MITQSCMNHSLGQRLRLREGSALISQEEILFREQKAPLTLPFALSLPKYQRVIGIS